MREDRIITFFTNIYDNTTNKTMMFGTWKEMEEFLSSLFNLAQTKKTAPLISPAVYKEGKTRSNSSVIEWGGWAGIDIDSGGDYENCKDENGNYNSCLLRERLNEVFPYRYLCYSTANCTQNTLKFRLIVPLQHWVARDRLEHLWHSLSVKLNRTVDKQTKDLSRMFFVPGNYPTNTNKFLFTNNLEILNPTNLLNEISYTNDSRNGNFNIIADLPEEIKEKFLSFKKQKLNQETNGWTSYKSCPFVKQSIVDDYFKISGNGWYHSLYSIMVSIAFNAVKSGYSITPDELVTLIREIDRDNGGWYDKRPIKVEAARAIQYAYLNF